MKGKKMENYITCPNCNKTISNEPIIEAAANKDYSEPRAITCDCGETITFWAITAQLRKRRTLGQKFKNWIQNMMKS
jgi:hypothetical protein